MQLMTPQVARSAVELPIDHGVLHGELAVPAGAGALVLFAHGSGSSRLSPRNRRVAQALQDAGMATLLFDLLTMDEEQEDDLTGELRFDIELLASRLVVASEWASAQASVGALPVGYFGASTGAAAALVAAADRPQAVQAVVSRGGRPDLAGAALPNVQAPTLLIVGSADDVVVALNQKALQVLGAPIKRLTLVPGATHLFEEPGAMAQVTDLAAAWFTAYLMERGAPASA